MKSKSALYLILTFLFMQPAFSQIQSGKIIYKVEAPKHLLDTIGGDKEQSNKFDNLWDEIRRAAPYLEFNLTFNDTKSGFEVQKQMSVDNGMDLNLAAMVSGVEGIYYTDLSEKERIHQRTARDKDWTVYAPIADFNWKMDSETKTILGYTCHKAHTTVRLNSKVKGEIIAWFCPDIPFQFGPLGFSGLPGIILGLERNHFYFYADHIDLNKHTKKIRFSTKGKRVSLDEYFEQVKNNPYEKMHKRRDGN